MQLARIKSSANANEQVLKVHITSKKNWLDFTSSSLK